VAVGAGVVEGATFSFATTDGDAVDDEDTYPDEDEDEPRSVGPRLVLPPVLLTPPTEPEPTEPEPRIPLLNPRLASALDKDSRLKLSSPLKLLGRGGKPPPFVDIVVVTFSV
jgi:hypothetical protein